MPSKNFNSLKNEIVLQLQVQIQKIAKELNKTPPSTSEIYVQLTACPKPELGQLTFACFILAKNWQLPPVQIATLLQKNILEDKSENIIQTSVNTGPYLNITLKKNLVFKLLVTSIASGKYFKPQFYDQHEKTLVEYSQPNTH